MGAGSLTVTAVAFPNGSEITGNGGEGGGGGGAIIGIAVAAACLLALVAAALISRWRQSRSSALDHGVSYLKRIESAEPSSHLKRIQSGEGESIQPRAEGDLSKPGGLVTTRFGPPTPTKGGRISRLSGFATMPYRMSSKSVKLKQQISKLGEVDTAPRVGTLPQRSAGVRPSLQPGPSCQVVHTENVMFASQI